ncbi:hypothetical protein H6F42_14475 [Pseudanabaena sp. FACHB-1998]|uniref:hypothetical protein n=1 Tax=Pseudanabaena sp. FACHB-1998 TaxID=2692858 RepID=UPI00168196FB|nr:hypothetical protein [Pseudanabaena sp. FACHB-1998]MBD2178122.1 hypothetical protein [Pseudanabaena sp. FACHB-1998]
MALFGLFGKKDNSKDSDKKESSYFLDQDSAKTFGNIDYMRTPKAVRKTFPTVNGVEGAEIVEIISATEKIEGKEIEVSNSTSNPPAPQPTFEPKKNTRVDSSMDIFLNMAKDIKKK